MDVAYDQIQEEALSPEEIAAGGSKKDGTEADANAARRRSSSLNEEFQEAYKSISTTAWGAKLGGFFNDVKNQGTSLYTGARQEATTAGGEALKGFTDLRETLVRRAKSLGSDAEGDESQKKEADGKSTQGLDTTAAKDVIARFQSEASKRLKDLEKAEEAADAAILRFGANIGNFLKDAVSIVPPTDGTSGAAGKPGQVLFESKDADGKRVIHSTRIEAQLHAIHTSLDKFTTDPDSKQFGPFKMGFEVEKKTDAIAQDLQRYEELRRSMEKLVPEKVEYKDFWVRYYFLRSVIDAEEQRRKEVLKGAAQSSEDSVGWDDESEDESSPSTPHQPRPKSSAGSIRTLRPSQETSAKPIESRRSQDEKSQAGSDASYDVVSGATSRASPLDSTFKKVAEDEDEEDWE